MRIGLVGLDTVQALRSTMWQAFVSALEAAGLFLVDLHDAHPGTVSGIVSFNCQERRILAAHGRHVPKRHRVLVVLEPPQTAPYIYRSRTTLLFGSIFAASPVWANMLQGSSFRWPVQVPNELPPRIPYRFASTLISANKRSAIKGSLYSLRRAVVHQARESNYNLGLFGVGWSSNRGLQTIDGIRSAVKACRYWELPDLSESLSFAQPQQSMGFQVNKYACLAAAPTTVVVENSATYVSEKLFDALITKTVPVYVGPQLERFGVPEDLVFRCEPTASDILSRLKSISPGDISQKAHAIDLWTSGSDFRAMESGKVLHSLGARVAAALRS